MASWQGSMRVAEFEMTDFVSLRIETADGAFVIRLNRPQSRNAISVEMMSELAAAVRQADADRSVSAVVITGGAGFFSTGRDLKEVAATTDRSSIEAAKAAWRAVTDAFETSPKPVIAAIEGDGLTGGLELALACDLRVAGEGARFGITSARLGTMPGFGATQRLPRLIGVSKALELLFFAEQIGVEEALRSGLIDRSAPRGDALNECLRMCRILSERAPLSLAAMKRSVYGGLAMPLSEGLDWELAMGATLAGTKDRKEGIAAFAEKRKPRFLGE
jgi:enoyl-CoA hydratase/carnithine racemase